LLISSERLNFLSLKLRMTAKGTLPLSTNDCRTAVQFLVESGVDRKGAAISATGLGFNFTQ
jgi:hypothetical protein